MKTLYLVMDLINDLVHPDGANGSGLAAEVTRRDVLKTRQLRLPRAGMRVFRLAM